MKKILLISAGILGLLSGMLLQADTTYVSGNITTNIVWDTTGSPYVVTSALTVDTLVTLKIDPGVTVISSADITINGTLNAIGTVNDSIIITGNTTNYGWGVITISPAAKCSLKYCRIEHAKTAVYNQSDDSVYVGYCAIQDNLGQTSLLSGIKNSGTIIITNNSVCDNWTSYAGIVNAGHAFITNNIISGNADHFEAGGGIWNWDMGEAIITGNTMSNNGCGIHNVGKATIMNNNITSDGGNGSGGIINGGPATIIGNNVSHNYGGGICNSHDSVVIAHNFISYNDCNMWHKGNNIENTGSRVTIKNNTIIDDGLSYDTTHPSIYNSGYDVVICSTNIYAKYCAIYNDSTDSVDARYNYWGTNDTNIIDAKIRDFYDDSSKGIVYYKPFISDSLIAIEEPSSQNWSEATSRLGGPKLSISQNPFSKSTVISYTVGEVSQPRYVSLAIYDLTGRLIKTLANGEKPAGTYSTTLNAKDLKTGIYFVRLTAGTFKETRKLVLMK
ncbi:MAG: T9SS type A sorting domain-containing protein [bacterium]|nr:T9SS type A sorting domain-containing protein [bacterium]